jgi:hypothetical protein
VRWLLEPAGELSAQLAPPAEPRASQRTYAQIIAPGLPVQPSTLTILKRNSPYSVISLRGQNEDGESSGERIGGDTRGENSHAGFESAGAARLRWSQSRRLGAALSRTGKRDADRSEKPLAKSFARAIPFSRTSPSEPLFGTQTVIVMNSCGPSSSAQIVTWRLLWIDVPT